MQVFNVFHPFSVLYTLLCVKKILKVQEVKVFNQRKLLCPTEKLFLKHLASSPAFNTATL